jgi:FdhE protein
MQRILEPGRIEAFAQRGIQRLRLPDRAHLFSRRAERLRQLAGDNAIGRAIGDYLQLMACMVDAQHAALGTFEVKTPTTGQLSHARAHGMPPVHASAWSREKHWPAPVDVASAPLLMAALQVYWVDIASRLGAGDVAALDVAIVCPVCGTPPVASIVRADAGSQGYRYLHCALCATEWHMVRVTCSHCQGTKGIDYRSIEGGSEAIRAECCDSCRTYRKILYQEKDSAVEPVADDLASLALDLLVSECGFHRASGNPLLWHSPQT